ncbi:DUF1660 family phage protein [Thiocapsa sp. N5-Cardenillas]|uniref:DUF1660 family phage protein n=1 Tax=Thiocapsa sp. N5-Cardenillas TaxID=3137397 RepID=UPI0035B08CE2
MKCKLFLHHKWEGRVPALAQKCSRCGLNKSLSMINTGFFNDVDFKIVKYYD